MACVVKSYCNKVNDIKRLKAEIKKLNEQLRIHDVIKSVCDCSSETFTYHYKGDDKCGYCGGKAES